MKTIKFLSSLFQALILVLLVSVAAATFGADPVPVFYVGLALTAVLTVVAAFNQNPVNALSATIFKEVWTGEIIKRVNILESFSWVNAIVRDYSRFVSVLNEEAQVIHLASFPIQPDVLIDNTTYPIPVQALTTSDVPISLNKLQTKVTAVTDDALYANTTNPMVLHAEAHANAVLETKFALGAWNICPSGNSAAMPVIVATGADDGTGRKKLQWADLVGYWYYARIMRMTLQVLTKPLRISITIGHLVNHLMHSDLLSTAAKQTLTITLPHWLNSHLVLRQPAQ
jgi:hypothetical protein